MTKVKRTVRRATRSTPRSGAKALGLQMVVKMMDLADLIPYGRNPRKRPQQAVDTVAASLKQFGWQQPIVVDTKNVIAAGHTRHAAALQLGWTSAPVVVIPDDQAPAYRLIDNRSAEFTAWDDDLLRAELEALPSLDGLDLEAFDFNSLVPPLPSDGLTDPDDVPADRKTGIRAGDVFTLGDHRLACGDSSRDFVSVFQVDGSGLVLTDPPYGISIVKGGRSRQQSKKPSKPFMGGKVGGPKPFGKVGSLGKDGAGGKIGPALRKGKVGGPGVVKPRSYFPVTNDDRPFDPAWLLTLGKHQIIFGGNHYATKLHDGTAWLVWDKQVADSSTFSGFELLWTSGVGRNRIVSPSVVRNGQRRRSEDRTRRPGTSDAEARRITRADPERLHN